MIPAADPSPADREPSDEALMLRLRSGDDAALAVLMTRWEAPIKRALARLVHNAHEAEDLAQDTFVRLYQHRGRFRDDARLSPWLYAIATNLARNRLRWWRRRPTVDLATWEQAGKAGVDESSSGAAPLEHRERAEAVRAAVASLPTNLREVLVLCEFEELPQEEAAAALGLTRKAVETRLHRARERLRARLGPLTEANRPR